MDRNGDWIQTYTGRKFYPLDPKPEEVDIYDIAHALALQCRFTGHIKTFYSVAQHSVLASAWIFSVPDHVVLSGANEQDRLWALLHDASEAYLIDLARPVKHDARLAFFREAEKRIQVAICERFGLPRDQPKLVDLVDRTLLVTEARDLFASECQWSANYPNPFEARIEPWNWDVAEGRFLERFFALGGGDSNV